MKKQVPLKLRMPLSFAFAMSLHTTLIFAVSFSFQPDKGKLPPTLDIILVQSKQDDKDIKDADYLSNISNTGGGEHNVNKRKKTLFQSSEKVEKAGIAQIQSQQQIKQQEKKESKNIHVDKSKQKIQTSDRAQQNKLTNKLQSITQPQLNIASLSSEINRQIEDFSKKPRKEFVHARTKHTPAAMYMHDWIKKVEYMGNKHYPVEARKQNLQGSLIMIVAIDSSGRAIEAKIKKSSGVSILDQAAKNIVYQSSPFAPFAGKLEQTTDILYITRTWQFRSNRFE
jgi:periplasmic protein TonB